MIGESFERRNGLCMRIIHNSVFKLRNICTDGKGGIMAEIIEKAANGQRRAMESLYEKNKRKIYYIAQSLLLDKNQASDAVIRVFENLWKPDLALKIKTEEEFGREVVSRVVEYCRKKVLKQDSKAFRTPPNKNFRIFEFGAYDGSEAAEDFVLRHFSMIQRFVFTLRAICGYECGEISGCIRLSSEVVATALDAEKHNIEKLLEVMGKKESGAYEAFVKAFADREADVVVPEKVDQQVLSVMDAIAKPMEKKKKTRTMIAGLVFAACVCVVVGLVLAFGSGQKDKSFDGQMAEGGTEMSDAMDEDSCYADIDIRDYGMITVKLDEKAAPATTENFIKLAESGFYNGLTFHRIIKGFMMQGGDPDGNGMGGSKETIEGEFLKNGYENPLSHTRGAIAMARSSDFNSASSQFYIVHEDSTFLDGQYAVFGYVTEGMDVVDKVCEEAAPTDSDGTIPADAQPVIESIVIRTK